MVVIVNKKRGLEPEFVPHGDMGIDKAIQSGLNNVNVETLYQTIKKSPEVTACMNAIVEDIMSDGWKFEGRQKPKKDAQDFVDKTRFFKKLANIIYDFLITGNGYQAKLSVNEQKFKSLLDRISQKEVMKKIGLSKKEVKEKMFYEMKQKGVFKPKDLQTLKSSTITIDYDEHGRINNYRQTVSGKSVIFKPDEIIHISQINIGGSVYGFTPLEPLLSDIATLIFGKEYAGKFFENNGIPNLLINLPEAMGTEDRNYQALKEALNEGKKKENKWRAIITTGPTNVEQIQPFTKEMQFVEMIKEFKVTVLMALGVPPERVNPQKSEGDNKLSDYQGYFKKINFLQRIIEETLNKELFSSFGDVKIRFNRSYKIDELREANIISILVDRGLISVEEAREKIEMERKMDGKPPKQRGQDRDTRALRGEDTRKPEEEELSQPRDRPNKPDNQTQ